MLRKQYPDLDLLESPPISASPFGSLLGGVPQSAIAEKIFNDPESWHETGVDVEGEHIKNQMTLFAEELENCDLRENGGAMATTSIEEEYDATLRPFSDRYRLVAKPTSTSPGFPDWPMKWEGVQEDDKQLFLPVFKRSNIESIDLRIRLSSIWEAGNDSFRSFSSPITFTPPPITEPPITPISADRAHLSPLNLGAIVRKTVNEILPSPVLSPVTVASASTTWSILEWYGVHPETPHLDRKISGPYPPSPILPVPPIPASLQSRPASSTNPILSVPTPPKPLTQLSSFANDHTPVRPLPVIPDTSRNSSTHPPFSNNAADHSVCMVPVPPSTVHSSGPDPFSRPSAALSPYFSRPGSASRSPPPAGPRPRSSALPRSSSAPPKEGQSCGRESPFTISPAPSRIRRNPSPVQIPPLSLRLAVKV